MKIVFMGTPEFAVAPLVELKNMGYEISLVITQKDRAKGRGKKIQPTPVKYKALELGLEVFQPETINSKESVNKIREAQPDFIVVVAYGQILDSKILKLPKYYCLNIHASLLPKYRGAAPINWAIIEGEKETGITIIKMDNGLDTGDMLLKKKIPIDKKDDSLTIHDKLSSLGGKAIVEAIEKIKGGDAIFTPQSDKLSSYAPKFTKELGRIDWNEKGENILNLIRGLKPWPSAYMEYKGESIKIHRASRVDKFSELANGFIVKVSDKGMFINCSDSCIVVEEFQFPGKRRISVPQYLRGNKLETNIRLK